MTSLRWIVILLFFLAAGAAAAQESSAAWTATAQPAFDPSKSATVDMLVITRDRIRITLNSGTIQFAQPANGVVFAAAFQGQGRLQIDPPNPLEKQQLQLLAKRDTVDLEFSQAIFSFTDGFFEEVARQVHWAAPSGSLGEIYVKRQNEREDVGASIIPRIFQGVLSSDHQRTAYFAAEVRSKDMGWVLARYDALDPEEVSVGRWAPRGAYEFFDTWMSFPAGNTSSGAAFRDPLAKETFVVRGYKIDASVTGGADLAATTQVRLESRASGERVVILDLSANARVDSVKDEKGTPLAFFQPREPKDRFPTYGDYVAVVLAQPSQPGRAEALEFQYAGKRLIRKEGDGNYFCPSYGWYPGQPRQFATRADFEMTFHYPKQYTLVATGSLTEDPKGGTSHWKSDIPLAVAGFAYGDFKEYQQNVNSVEVDVFVNRNPDKFLWFAKQVLNPDDPGMAGNSNINRTPDVMPTGSLDPSATIKQINTEIANSLKVFQDYFGPYPYKHLAVTNIPYPYGQGWPGLLYLSVLSFLDSTQRHAFGVSDQIGVSDFFRAHETSHQWWGHRVGWKSYHDQWMSEGFAQFSGNLYVQFRENPKEYLNRLRLDRQEILNKNSFGHVYESLGPVWMGDRLASSEAPGGYDIVIYDKGGYILHMLRMMLNDPGHADPDHYFKDLLHDFCQTYDNKAASTEDFKAIVEKRMFQYMDIDKTHKMDWFFNEYVYGTGVPHYNFEYQVHPEGDKWYVSGTITQSGVPDGWKDILPVYVHVPNRVVRLGWVRVAEKSTPVHFNLPMRPDKVSLNDNEDILAIVKQ